MGHLQMLDTAAFASGTEWPEAMHDCRKFDIRQWVLVTSSAPMTAWFYQDCYLRFCAEDYSLSDLTNVFSHLSNNCIARKSLHFESGLVCF